MENLIYCLNTTVPLFLLMLLGAALAKTKLFSDNFAGKLNTFVFRISLPVLVFVDLATTDFSEAWNGKYVLACFIITVISIIISVCVSMLFRKGCDRAEFVQASFRSSAALLGIGIIQNIYGNSGMAPMMIVGAVPLYNVFAVVILSVLVPDENGDAKLKGISGKTIKKTLKGIVTNPIIIGIAAGLLWSVLRLPMPTMLYRTLNHVGNCATPMGLIALGASLKFDSVKSSIVPAITASFMKLVVFVAIFIPIVIKMGYRNDILVSTLIMLGSPTTVSCYIMARNMNHEGAVSASCVMITTLFSAFTLTLWLYILKAGSYI